jgi:hypothetical protein
MLISEETFDGSVAYSKRRTARNDPEVGYSPKIRRLSEISDNFGRQDPPRAGRYCYRTDLFGVSLGESNCLGWPASCEVTLRRSSPVVVLPMAPAHIDLDAVRGFSHNSRSTAMKYLIMPLLLVAGFIAMSTVEANAVVCAAGVYRAGCVAAGGGAVVVRRPAVVARRAVVVAPRVGVRRRVY